MNANEERGKESYDFATSVYELYPLLEISSITDTCSRLCFDQEVLSGTAFISAIIDHTSVSAHTHTYLLTITAGGGWVGGGISSHEKSWGWGYSSHEQSWEGFFI